MKNVEVVKDSNLKNKKGITLIALVVTIVVLLILAGVTILTLTGENGILKRASNAAEATQKETAKEKMNFKITNIQINTYAKEQRTPTLQEIADEFYEDDEIEYVITKEEVAAKEKIDVTGYSSIFTKLSEYPYEFEIDSSLRLASINGVKIADNSSSLEEIVTLKATIADMQQEIADLKSSQTETNSELETAKLNVENLTTEIKNLKDSGLHERIAVDITSPSVTGSWTKVADYPTGYTKDNCYASSGYLKTSDMGNYTIPLGGTGYKVWIKTSDSGIDMLIETTGFANYTGQIFLEKID